MTLTAAILSAFSVVIGMFVAAGLVALYAVYFIQGG